jgi:hypothetical protein
MVSGFGAAERGAATTGTVGLRVSLGAGVSVCGRVTGSGGAGATRIATFGEAVVAGRSETVTGEGAVSLPRS